MDPCTKSKEIDHICSRMEKMEETIDGNGKPGVKAELIMIKEEQKATNKEMSTMNGTMARLSTNVASLMIFMAEQKTADKIKIRMRDVVYMVISLVIAAAAVIVTWLATKGGA